MWCAGALQAVSGANIVTVTKITKHNPSPDQKRRRGRPPRGTQAMTGAQRTALYRKQQKDDQVLESLQLLGRVNLVEMLGRDLRSIEDYLAGRGAADAELLPDLLAGARLTAGRLVAELIKRYELVLPRKTSSRG